MAVHVGTGQAVGAPVSISTAGVNTSGLVSSNTQGMQLMVTTPLAGALTRTGAAQLKQQSQPIPKILPNQTMIAPQIAARGLPGHVSSVCSIVLLCIHLGMFT